MEPQTVISLKVGCGKGRICFVVSTCFPADCETNYNYTQQRHLMLDVHTPTQLFVFLFIPFIYSISFIICLFNHSFHLFNPFIHFIYSFHLFILFINSIHSIYSFHLFIHSIYSFHSFCSFLPFIHSIYSFHLFISFIHSTYSFFLLIPFIHSIYLFYLCI